MINIKKMIEKWLADGRQDEQYRTDISNPTAEGIACITNKISGIKGDVSFNGANLGNINIDIHMHAEQPTSSQRSHVATSAVTAKLDAIRELSSKCKFTDALSEYEELLKDYSLMSTMDKNSQSRVLLGIVSSYINMADYENAEKYLNRFKREGLPLDDNGYSIVASYYLNQRQPALYNEAERIATQALADFPSSMICICLFALVKSIVDVNFDGRQYLDSNMQSLNNNDDKKRYYETLCNILITRRDFNGVVSTYKELDFKPSLLIHSQYVNSLYASIVYKKDKDFIGRSDIDFAELYAVWQTIQVIEDSLTENEVSFFHCLIADVYLNCIVLLGKELSQISKDLLLHAHEGTKNNVSLWLSIFHDFNYGFDVPLAKNDKVNIVDGLLEQQKYMEIYNYLWPAIKTDEELQRLFKHLFMNVCLLLRDDAPEYFIEGIRHFKQVGLFDNYMKMIECAYVYHAESKQRALHELSTLYDDSQDPAIIMELVKFAYRVGEISFAAEKLDDIKHNKPFVIDIEPNHYFEQCFRLYTDSQQGGKIITLIEDSGRYSITDTLKLRMGAARAEFLEDLPTVAEVNLQLYEYSDDIRYLYRSCEVYLVLCDTTKLDSTLGTLSRAKGADEINVNILHAHYYVLLGDIKKAIDAAKKAKDLSVDLPTSPAHQLYWSLCFRNGNMDAVGYIGEYAAKYPKHTQWVRGINAIEKDEKGNDVLTSEARQLFEGLRDDYIKTMQMYKKHYEYGISLLKDRMNWRYSDIGSRITILKAFTGNIELFNLDKQKDISKIALDSLSLYFIESIGCLELLKNCCEVYMDYKTITLLTSDLLINEDERIRRILRFIKTSSNIIFTYPSLSGREVISKFNIKKSDASSFSCLLNACVIAHDNNIPIVYLDMLAQPLSKITGTETVSLLAFVKSAHALGWLKDTEFGQALLCMSKLNYMFMNIDCSDLYYSLLVKDFCIDESIKKLFEISPSADAKSYVPVFIGLLQRLRAEGRQETIENIVIAFVEALDKRHGRTRAEYWRASKDQDMFTLNRLDYTRSACEAGISSVCTFLLDFKSFDEVRNMICEKATRIPIENRTIILDMVQEIYSAKLKHK